uniref:Uncharacterized protein n=1 Tax=Brassica oleracea TaxID=3712 RepID=A0A3P6ARX6_BRAOL|nr:unnamed protein product [Brassica oleracea]
MRRLPQAFEIGMPECKERAEILKVTLKGERRNPRGIEKMETMSSKFHMKMFNAVAFTKFASVDVTQVAAGEYCGLRWSREPDEVEAAIIIFWICSFFYRRKSTKVGLKHVDLRERVSIVNIEFLKNYKPL